MGWKQRVGWAMVAVATCSLGGAAVQAQEPDMGLFVIGQSATVPQGREVDVAVVIGGDLDVAGRVRGPAVTVGGDLLVQRSASIDGNVVAVGGALQVDEAAQVAGPRIQVSGGDYSTVMAELSEAEAPDAQALWWIGSIVRVVQMFAVFVMAIFLLILMPRQMHAVRATLTQQSARSTAAGLGLLVGFVPFCFLLAVTVVGIPLIPVAVLALLVTVVMGLTALALALGTRLLKIEDPGNLFKPMALGVLLIAVVSAIPVLGAVLLALASLYAAGGVLISHFGTIPPGAPKGAAGTTEVPVTVER